VTDGRICSQRCTRAACSTVNLPPTANAGPDQTVALNAVVVLNGASSSDPEGGALTFQWTLLQKPAGSAAALDLSDPVHPTFVVDKHGNYVVRLVVKDPLNAASSPDTVQVSTLNSPPLANAGPDQTALVSQTVTLDGHLSSDADGDALQMCAGARQQIVGICRLSGLRDGDHQGIAVVDTAAVQRPDRWSGQRNGNARGHLDQVATESRCVIGGTARRQHDQSRAVVL